MKKMIATPPRSRDGDEDILHFSVFHHPGFWFPRVRHRRKKSKPVQREKSGVRNDHVTMSSAGIDASDEKGGGQLLRERAYPVVSLECEILIGSS
ncbi:unnamed protein product [Clavelina lepadiformis]|uniref:Uncharacterized protein n=1 Tax=Clavelina lepadiformis TaxID=159417 RepID=A0ABP0FI77_CLALP